MTYPVTLCIFFRRRFLATTVEENGSTLFLGASNQILDSLLGLGADDWSKIRTFLKA
jgi:hypothetical protein